MNSRTISLSADTSALTESLSKIKLPRTLTAVIIPVLANVLLKEMDNC